MATIASPGTGNVYVTGNLLPTSPDYNLGLPSLPWLSSYFGPHSVNILAESGDPAEAITISNDLGNTIISAGGFVILGNSIPVFEVRALTGQLYSNAQTIIVNTTQSANVTSGSLQTAGGAGIAKNLYVGGSINTSLVQCPVSNNSLELNSANLGFVKLSTQNAGPIEIVHGNNSWSFSGTTLSLPVSPPSPDRPDSEIYAESMLIRTGDGDLKLQSVGNLTLDGNVSVINSKSFTTTGSRVLSTGYQDGNVNPATPTLLDTTKQVHKLADSYFRLADGVEGQICYFAMNDSAASAEDILIVVNHLRISQSGAANVRVNAVWRPFPYGPGNFVSTLASAIFTDDGWSVSQGTIV